ncbi:MAG: phosphohydrolase, partial [Oscillospiraceae bacterium]
RRSRVRNKEHATFDIHDRVNFAVESATCQLNDTHTTLTLQLKLDTDICPVMEYFEIFLDRMLLCRKAAEKLAIKFELYINSQKIM